MTLESLYQQLQNNQNLRLVLMTVLLIAVYWASRKALYQTIEGNPNLKKKAKDNVKSSLNRYLTFAFAITLIIFWFSTIQGFLVSLVAVAAAIVIAFKEIIMCLTGGWLLRLSDHYETGDRIELAGVRGYVISKNIVTTKLLIVGPEAHSQQTTGDVVTIPNSLLLNSIVKNESQFLGYTIESFVFRPRDLKEIADIEKKLIEWSSEIIKSYVDSARKSIERFCHKEGIESPTVAPRTKVLLDEENKPKILLKIPVKVTEIADIEQVLNRKYVQYLIDNPMPVSAST